MKTKGSIFEEAAHYGSLNSRAAPTNKTTSIVARLMGWEGFTKYESTSSKTKMGRKEASFSGDGDSMRNLEVKGTRASQGAVRKSSSCPKLRVEPIPWRQQGSVYGEIQKRISELEFQKSGRDLRVLKQLLEAMQKTKNQCKEKSRFHAASISRTTPKEIEMQPTSTMIVKPAKLKEQVMHAERQQIRNPKNHMPSVQKQENLWQKSRNTMDHDGQGSSTCVMVETCTTSGRSLPTQNLSSRQSLQKKSKRDNEGSDKKLGGKGTPFRRFKLNQAHQECNSQDGKACQNSTIQNTLAAQTAEIMQMAHSRTLVTGQKQINSRVCHPCTQIFWSGASPIVSSFFLCPIRELPQKPDNVPRPLKLHQKGNCGNRILIMQCIEKVGHLRSRKCPLFLKVFIPIFTYLL